MKSIDQVSLKPVPVTSNDPTPEANNNVARATNEPIKKLKVLLYSMDYNDLADHPYLNNFTFRGQFHLKSAAKECNRVIAITPSLVNSDALDYHLDTLFGAGAKRDEWRSRIMLRTAAPARSGSGLSLADRVLDDPALIAELKEAVEVARSQGAQVVLRSFQPSRTVEQVAQIIGADMSECAADLAAYYGSKEGSKQVFRQAGIPTPRSEDKLFESVQQVADAVRRLATANPPAVKVMIKLSDPGWGGGDGNALVDCRTFLATDDLAASVVKSTMPWPEYKQYIPRDTEHPTGGAIVEEFLENIHSSPSGQGRIIESRVKVLSGHDQLLRDGGCYEGCAYPAEPDVRERINEYVARIGEVLRAGGARGTFGVDFVKYGDDQLAAIEINLRVTGTCHPLSYARAAMKAKLDPKDNLLRGTDGVLRHYVNKHLHSEALEGLSVREALARLESAGLAWDPQKQLGVILTEGEGLIAHGFCEVTCVARSRSEAIDMEAMAERLFLP